MSLLDAARVARALDDARHATWEDPATARATAVRCHEVARTLGSDALRARALVVQGTVTLNRGDLRGAFGLAAEAHRLAERSGDPVARLEVAALQAQLNFFSGAYTDALRQAGTAIELSDALGDPVLRVYARRASCMVLGNLEAPNWLDELLELLRLSIEIGDRWQEAVSRNDLGHHLMATGDPAGADRELALGFEVAARIAPANRVALAALHCTRAELRLRTDRPAEALADAGAALQQLTGIEEPNPYVFGMTVRMEVQAQLALGRPDDAQRSGEAALARLGDSVPQARSMILETVATALREAGRVEAAYDALARGAALERAALLELTELQLGFQRAELETRAARIEADALASKNRELEAVLARLASTNAQLRDRTVQLETLRDQLREQADRDPLTGLHNRRYLTTVLDRLSRDPQAGPTSVAVLDLDRFKTINDDYGHAAGDQVLVRTAAVLRGVMRTEDTIARTGGEEFILLMPGTDADAASSVCERLLAVLRGESWQRIGDGLSVTGSIGVATADHGASVLRLAELADAQLYEAKRAGRDRVRHAVAA
jgi:diguanylate cyclase (GGDEF)-like protein